MLGLQALLNLQKELDGHFESVSDITGDQKLTADLLGLMVECGEACNEISSFKYWKKNKYISKTKLREELADVLFMYLVVLNDLEISGEEIEEAYLRKYAINRERMNEGY